MAIQIGDKSYEVDKTVEGYINALSQTLADTKKKLETAKEDAIKELKAEYELREMRVKAKEAGIEVGDNASPEYLKGIVEGLKVGDSNFKPLDKNINFDDIVVEV